MQPTREIPDEGFVSNIGSDTPLDDGRLPAVRYLEPPKLFEPDPRRRVDSIVYHFILKKGHFSSLRQEITSGDPPRLPVELVVPVDTYVIDEENLYIVQFSPSREIVRAFSEDQRVIVDWTYGDRSLKDVIKEEYGALLDGTFSLKGIVEYIKADESHQEKVDTFASSVIFRTINELTKDENIGYH